MGFSTPYYGGGLQVRDPLRTAVIEFEDRLDRCKARSEKIKRNIYGDMYHIVKTFEGFDLPDKFTTDEYKELYEFWKQINEDL